MDLKPYAEMKQKYDNLKGYLIQKQIDNTLILGTPNKHQQEKVGTHVKNQKN